MKNLPWIILFVLLGTTSRLLFGVEYQLWNQSPDQIAWELNLQELFVYGDWSFDRLIHYPHEGGTILISLFSLLFKAFTPLHSLVLSAFVLDAIFRFIQLFVVQEIGGKKSMIAYGMWLICALPLLISWGGVNYGLHAISAVFPFVFIYLLFREHHSNMSYIIDGLFLGFAGWFLYSNFLFIPIYFLYLMYKKSIPKNYVISAFTILLVVFAHVLVRSLFDAGFHLSEFNATSIRGEEFELLSPDTYDSLLSVWTGAVRESSLLRGASFISSKGIQWAWFILSLVGVGSLLYASAKRKSSEVLIFGILVILIYVSAYSISPFCIEDASRSNYVLSRHMTYILPLFMALSLIGLVAYKKMTWLVIPMVMISIFGFAMQFKNPKSDSFLVRASGWVLSTKLGHDPNRLSKIAATNLLDEEENRELKVGYGWGLGTSLFQGIVLDSTSIDQVDLQTSRLIILLDDIPQADRKFILEGISYAFSDAVTPRLDKNILINKIKPKFNSIPSLQ